MYRAAFAVLTYCSLTQHVNKLGNSCSPSRCPPTSPSHRTVHRLLQRDQRTYPLRSLRGSIDPMIAFRFLVVVNAAFSPGVSSIAPPSLPSFPPSRPGGLVADDGASPSASSVDSATHQSATVVERKYFPAQIRSRKRVSSTRKLVDLLPHQWPAIMRGWRIN